MVQRIAPSSRLMAFVAAATLVGGLLLGAAGPVLADHSDGKMYVDGTAGCVSWFPACESWTHESPEGVHVWSAVDERSISGDGSANRSRHDVGYQEQRASDGTLTSVTVRGQLTTSNSNGGSAQTDFGYDLDIDELGTTLGVSGTVSTHVSGGEFIVSDAQFAIRIECDSDTYEYELERDAGGSEPHSAAGGGSPSKTLDSSGGNCSIEIDGGIVSNTNRPAPGESGAADMTFSVTLTLAASAGCEGLHGNVADGRALGDEATSDGHDNWLVGVKVQLQRDGHAVGPAVATDAGGGYCIQTGNGVEAGPYLVRATLIDAAHEPPVFETRHAADGEAAWAETSVTEGNFGPDNGADIAFSKTADKPWLADVANIHWQSQRMVDWILTRVGLSPAQLGPFTIIAYSAKGTSYSPTTHEVRINSDGTEKDDSIFFDRSGSSTECPENCEWHEIGHHLAEIMDIAPVLRATECSDREAHGGWYNATTCDSVAEGFATFVATVASLEIDASRRDDGFGDSWYSSFGDLEDNVSFPWTALAGNDGQVRFYEDFAVAELLWDLVDDTPGEEGPFEVRNPAAPETSIEYAARDRVSLGANNLVRILGEIRPNTVAALYQGLLASAVVPQNVKTPDVSLLGEEEPGVSALDELFLLHGFHPVGTPEQPAYVVGTPVSMTDHEPAGAGLVVRPHAPSLAGANILLQNPSAEDVTVSIQLTGPRGTTTRTVRVAPASSTVFHYEARPYWRGVLPESGLPACGGAGQAPTMITLTGSGVAPRTLDSCEYLHAVVTAVDGVALTYAVGVGDPTASPPPGSAPAPDGSRMAIVIGGVALLVALLGALAFVLRRERRNP